MFGRRAAAAARSDEAIRTRSCPHCEAPIRVDLSGKCAKCGKRLTAYCFSCYAPIADPKVPSCAACGRRRWVVGDFADLPCASEAGAPSRSHRFMTTVTKGGKVLLEWRCMKCLTDETRTDAFSHFPGEADAIA